MISKMIHEVQVGDVIVQGKTMTPITGIDRTRCKSKTHINDKDCWENITEVLVIETTQELQDA